MPASTPVTLVLRLTALFAPTFLSAKLPLPLPVTLTAQYRFGLPSSTLRPYLGAGFTYGATDDFGFNATENRVHVHDLQATILHQLGLNHERLTYKFQGRNFRLTDVHGHVVKDILS